MSASTLSPAPGDTGANADQQFNILALYADLATGRRAQTLHDRLIKQFPQDLNPILRLSRFDLLNDINFFIMAAKEAMDANLLIISAHRAYDLPSTVERWVETVLELKQDFPTALVALLDGNQPDPLSNPNSIYAHIQDTTCRANVEFFSTAEQIRF
jgi:hypothetical protein